MSALGSLLFVLALLWVVLHLLRRLTGGGASGAGGALALTVLRRVSLGPRQGVAVVRIGERVVVLSTGEGGVRQLLELNPGEVESAASSTAPSTRGAAARAPLSLLASGADYAPAGARRVTFVESLRIAMRRSLPFAVILLLAATTHTAAAQDSTTAPAVAPVTAPATTPGNAPAVTAPATTPATRPLIQGTPRQPPVAQLPTRLQRATAGTGSIAGVAAGAAAGKPQFDLRFGNDSADGLHLSGPVGTIVMLGLLTMLPTLVLLMTSFTRILIVLQLLRQALGTQSAPPGHLIAAFALLLTGFVMAPTLAEANRTAIEPWLDGRMEQTEMLRTAVVPFRQFMLRQTREQDLATFVEMSGTQVAAPDSVSLPVLVSAFATSELRSAFQIGFVLFLPFIIIDIVVAAVLMSMGMFMLPPAMISLPFKLLLFVLVDGWTLIVQSLVASFR